MDIKKTILGIIIIYIGTIFLLENFDMIDFNYWIFLLSWPICIILTGVHLISKELDIDSKNKLILFSTIIALLFITSQGVDPSSRELQPFSNFINISKILTEEFSQNE